MHKSITISEVVLGPSSEVHTLHAKCVHVLSCESFILKGKNILYTVFIDSTVS